MDIGNLIFVFIVVFVVCIWVLWMAFVIGNIVFEITILRYFYKRNKLDIVSHFSEGLIWVIKNGFLFFTFKSNYYQDFREKYRYDQIKSKKYRGLVDKFSRISKVFFAIFNMLFVCILGITFISFVISILFFLNTAAACCGDKTISLQSIAFRWLNW